MKRDVFHRYALWGLALLYICFITLLAVEDLFALLIPTVDSEGEPVHVEEEVLRDPDKFTDEIKADLRRGDLGRVGVISEHLLAIRPHDCDLRAIQSVFFASKGDLSGARAELNKMDDSCQETKYVLYARAMILRLEKDFGDALNACERAIAKDRSHPYPWNIQGRIYFDKGEG